MKIYTKTGDDGTTSLIGGKRVAKNHPRVEAYGTIDELTCWVAHLRDSINVECGCGSSGSSWGDDGRSGGDDGGSCGDDGGSCSGSSDDGGSCSGSSDDGGSCSGSSDKLHKMGALNDDLVKIMNHLMFIGTYLATDSEKVNIADSATPSHNIVCNRDKTKSTFCSANISFIENRIDEIDSTLAQIKVFTIPGGHPLVSTCHIARTVCRRAERVLCTLSDEYEVDLQVCRYVNRLSDYLYLVTRKLTTILDAKEDLWVVE